MPAKILEFRDSRKKPAPATASVTPVDLGNVKFNIGGQRFTARLSASIESGGEPASTPPAAEIPPFAPDADE